MSKATKARRTWPIIAFVSILVNALFLGLAVRLWIGWEGAPSAVFFSLPGEVREQILESALSDNGRISMARERLATAREALREAVDADTVDLAVLEQASARVRDATTALQEEIHALILQAYSARADR